MARTSPDYLFAKLIHGYLAHADSITAGLPVESVLPRVLMDDGKVARLPCLLIAGMEDKDSKTAGRRVIGVTTFLFYRLKKQDADAPADTASLIQVCTRQQASEWMDLIESRLRNTDALGAYIATLPEVERTGWSLMAYRCESCETVKRDKDDAGHQIACTVRFYVAWSAAV